jgi:hypothetical protein
MEKEKVPVSETRKHQSRIAEIVSKISAPGPLSSSPLPSEALFEKWSFSGNRRFGKMHKSSESTRPSHKNHRENPVE